MKISIVIPNYNGEKLLQKNLPKVAQRLNEYGKKHDTMVELIINDDGSTDTSREILKTFEGKKEGNVLFTVIYNDKNYGFSTTVNRGVAKAKGSVVVLLNSDVIPEKDFLEPLLSHFSDDRVFGVGCMDRSVEKDGIVLRGRGIGFWERGFLMHKKGSLTKDNTLWVSGGSSAFRKDLWEKFQGLNEMMNPFYWEDIDLSYRALKSGYRLVFEKESTVIHEHEEGAIKKTVTSHKVKMTAYRNQFYFVWTNISDVSMIINHVLWLPYHILKALIHRDSAFLKGFFSAVVMLPNVLERRKIVQQLFKVSDKVVLREFRQ